MQRIIIDTDPGVDDSMAILLAFNSPELKIEGLTTVFGNTGSDVTTENALRLVELAGPLGAPGDLKYAVALGMLIILLLFRPQGLLGRAGRVG